MSADKKLVSQICNNILKEAREMAMPNTLIEMKYAVHDMMTSRKLGFNDTVNSLLSFEISFEGNERAISRGQKILNASYEWDEN